MRVAHSLVEMAAAPLVALLLAFALGTSSLGAEQSVPFDGPADQSGQYQQEVLASELSHPTGLAIRPIEASDQRYELFVAESGAGRVVSLSTDSPSRVSEAVVGFPLSQLGKYRVGPLALTFLNSEKLAIAASVPAGRLPQIAVYSIRQGEAAMAQTQADYTVDVDRKSGSPIGYLAELTALAVTNDAVYLSGANLGADGWILKSELDAHRLAPLKPFMRLGQANRFSGFAAPVGMPAKRPAFFVAGGSGSLEIPQDSRLAFCLPETGEVVMNLPTGLHDIVALAYSPTGQLYAADASWRDEQTGGVYRIEDARIDRRQTCRAVKIASVVRPFAIAFGPDGALYTTSLGAEDKQRDGKLIKITGDL